MTSLNHLSPYGLGQRLSMLKREAKFVTSSSLSLKTSIDNIQDYVAQSGQTDRFNCFMVEFMGIVNAQGLTEGFPSIQKLVDEWLQENLANITERSEGPAAWRFGVYCEPGEAWWLARQGYKKFEKALEARVLHIRIQPWDMEYAG